MHPTVPGTSITRLRQSAGGCTAYTSTSGLPGSLPANSSRMRPRLRVDGGATAFLRSGSNSLRITFSIDRPSIVADVSTVNKAILSHSVPIHATGGPGWGAQQLDRSRMFVLSVLALTPSHSASFVPKYSFYLGLLRRASTKFTDYGATIKVPRRKILATLEALQNLPVLQSRSLGQQWVATWRVTGALT